MTGLRVGQVAAAAGVNRETLRYYERRGIIDEPARTLGGHRLYPQETVTVLRAVKAAQRLGFSLSEVTRLLGRGAGLRTGAVAKLAEVERRIAALTATAEVLRTAVAVGCDDLVDCADAADCPIPFDGLTMP